MLSETALVVICIIFVSGEFQNASSAGSVPVPDASGTG
jgi:hypothetical protein